MKKILLFIIVLSAFVCGCQKSDKPLYFLSDDKTAILILAADDAAQTNRGKYTKFYYRIDRRDFGDYDYEPLNRRGDVFWGADVKFVLNGSGLTQYASKGFVRRFDFVSETDMCILLHELQAIYKYNHRIWNETDYSEQLDGVTFLLDRLGAVSENVGYRDILADEDLTINKIIRLRQADAPPEIISLLSLFL